MTLQRMQHVGAAPLTGVASPFSSSATSFTILSGTGYPTGSPGPFVLKIDAGTPSEEKILCSSLSGTTVTVAGSGRGFDNTVAAAHNAGTTNVEHDLAAVEIDDANDHVYTTSRDDHTQYSRVDGTRAFTGGVTVNTGGVTIGAGGLTVTAGGILVSAGNISTPGVVTGTQALYGGGAGTGAPVSGTYATGDFIVDSNGVQWTCVSGGTPGTWVPPVGYLVGSGTGPSANLQVINTTTTVVTVTVTLTANFTYEVNASGFFTIITSNPNFVNMQMTDNGGLLPGTCVFNSLSNAAYQVGNIVGGSTSYKVTPGSTGSYVFTLKAASNGAGEGIEFFGANQCHVQIKRCA